MSDSKISHETDLKDIEEDFFDTIGNQSEHSDADIDSSFDSQDLDSLDLLKERYKNDTETRDQLAKKTTWLIIGWLVFVGVMLVSSAIGWFRLSDTVLVTLLATTTVNVLGLAHTVLKGYFQYMSQDIELFKWRKQRKDR